MKNFNYRNCRKVSRRKDSENLWTVSISTTVYLELILPQIDNFEQVHTFVVVLYERITTKHIVRLVQVHLFSYSTTQTQFLHLNVFRTRYVAIWSCKKFDMVLCNQFVFLIIQPQAKHISECFLVGTDYFRREVK